METIALIFAALAAVVHGYIFVLESFLWTKPGTRKTFGMSEQVAEASKPLAFNQGFYNLFLGVATVIGGALLISGWESAGRAVLLISLGSMVAASIVLLLSDHSKLRPALVQGVLPLVGFALFMMQVFAQ